MRKLALVALFALVVGACDWPMDFAGPSHTGSTPDTSIGPAALATNGLATAWTAPGPVLVHAAAGGRVYGSTTSLPTPFDGVAVFDADGGEGCSGSPLVCEPLWTTSGGALTRSAAVVDGVLVTEEVAAYDAAGVVNCAGTPKVCAPLWTAAGPDGTVNVTVSRGRVYQAYSSASEGRGVAVYDLDGDEGCSGAPLVCSPLWTSPIPASNLFGGVSVGAGVAAIKSNTGLYAFDAEGVDNCGGAPTECSPLWRADIPGGSNHDLPVVAAGRVLVTSGGLLNVYGFDVSGASNCAGVPTTCTPVFVAKKAATQPAVAGSTLFSTYNRFLVAFDLSGNTRCSGSAVTTCGRLWKTPPHDGQCNPPGPCDVLSLLTVANDVVYQGYTNAGVAGGDVTAYDATGTLNCVRRTCQPIGRWSGPSAGIPIVANGFVITGGSTMGVRALTARHVP